MNLRPRVLALALLAGVIAVSSALAGSTPTPTGEAKHVGAQAKPGGIVKDQSGYYDPSRSTYVATPTTSAGAPTGSGVQAKPGGIVKDQTGYYDPSRSTYVVAAATSRSTSVPPAGFNWIDATIGAGAATGTILLLLGVTVLTIRRRSIAA
jgi:hypothetical protein